jgi:hypothetical protein
MRTSTFEELAGGVHGWAVDVTDDRGTQVALEKYVLAICAELADVVRNASRGNTTVKVCHPEGVLRKGFINDREISTA